MVWSQDMKIAWNNFTISRVSRRDIGTKFLNRFEIAIKYNKILHKTEDPDADTSEKQKRGSSIRFLIAIDPFREEIPCLINCTSLHNGEDHGAEETHEELGNENEDDLLVRSFLYT